MSEQGGEGGEPGEVGDRQTEEHVISFARSSREHLVQLDDADPLAGKAPYGARQVARFRILVSGCRDRERRGGERVSE